MVRLISRRTTPTIERVIDPTTRSVSEKIGKLIKFATAARSMRLLFGALALSAFALAAGNATALADPLRVAGTASGKPFTFLNVQTNELQGIMVDLIEAVAESEGLDVEVDVMTWASIIPALNSGRIDVGIAAAIITENRAKVVDFTEPLFPYGEGVIVRPSDTRKISSVGDLEGLTVGTQADSMYYALLKNSGVKMEIKVYDGAPEIIHDLDMGRLDAGMASYPILAMQLAEGDTRYKLASTYKSADVGQVAFMVQKGHSELIMRLNAGIKKLRSSGKIQEAFAKWGLDNTYSQ